MNEEKSLKDMPYASWLESFIRELLKNHPDSMAVSVKNQDGSVMTAYYKCTSTDKVCLAWNIALDAILDSVAANAGQILSAAEQEDDDDTE